MKVSGSLCTVFLGFLPIDCSVDFRRPNFMMYRLSIFSITSLDFCNNVWNAFLAFIYSLVRSSLSLSHCT